MSKFKIACCQFLVGKDKDKNIEKAKSFIEEASKNQVDLIILPECFNR
jgi:predicted amidohydrolase